MEASEGARDLTLVFCSSFGADLAIGFLNATGICTCDLSAFGAVSERWFVQERGGRLRVLEQLRQLLPTDV